MKTLLATLLFAGLALLAPAGASVRAADREAATVESAAEVLQALVEVPFQGIPRALLQDAQGIAIIPGMLKAGFVVGGRHGHGVILARGPNGVWNYPVFVTLTGGSIGWQIGVQSTDVVLVFKTRNGLDRILNGRGNLTLGADVAVAAGPVGRQAEAGTDGRLQAEIYSYSRSRGLFAGLSVEGAGVRMDGTATEVFYYGTGPRPAPGQPVAVPAVAEKLRSLVTALTAPPAPPPVVYPARMAPIPAPAYAPPGPPPAVLGPIAPPATSSPRP